VRRLRRTGVRLALDDFGTGYNTLIQLDRLPVDIIKLDSRLTAIGPLPSRTETLCAAVIALATSLGVSVIAEGVEHLAQEEALVRSGARFGQGYRYGRPGPLAERAERAEPPVVVATSAE
jgi:EAL domain-containing protein (putative c-di-GMP-specific phosphodiesterase class I)